MADTPKLTNRLNRWSRTLHRWGAVLCALPVLIVIATGLLLLVKKQVPWVQPPTTTGLLTNATPEQTWSDILDVLRGIEEADVTDWEDIDRLDVRPALGIVKVRCNNCWEVQLDLASGDVLASTYRRSDLIESLHDGSFIGASAKLWLFLPSGILMLLLWITGIWLWYLPWHNRRRKKTGIKGQTHLLCGVALAVLLPVDRAWSQSTTAEARLKSWERHLRLQKESDFKHLQWKSVGPRKQGGRIESIACPPGNTSVMYVGVGSGNLWKTVNNGITWRPIFEHESTGAIGDVAVARSDPNVVWLGTGEVLMARSALPGMGVFKSTDAGKTWRNMGLNDTHHIGRVLIDPTDADVVYVAAIGHRSSRNEQRGLFKTIDGGKTWKRTLFVDDRTSVIDMCMEPGNRNTLYATTWQRDPVLEARDGQDHFGRNSGIHKSVDGGSTWRRLTGGLPTGDAIGRIGIDISASNPAVVYALVDQGPKDALYRSNDGGRTWKRVNRDPVQARWDWCEIRVSPDNENELYNIGQRSFVSRDGGATFEQIGGTIVHLLPHDSRILHLDTHAMWIDPLNTDRIVFGNDGGLFFSYDRGANWLHVNNLPIAECYAVTCDMDRPYNIYIGTQDNAALYGPSNHVPEDGGPDHWQHVYLDRWGGGDSYFTYRDPTDHDTIYYENQYGGLKRKTMSTGDTRGIRPTVPSDQPPLRFAWMAPFFPSFHEPRALYFGANRVFKSANRGEDWLAISPDLADGEDTPNLRYKAITTMAESQLQPGLLFAGTDNGNLFVTRNDGESWDSISDGLPRHAFTRVAASGHDKRTVFVTLTGMAVDDFSPLVFRSNDQGRTWTSIAHGLPLEPANVIREDPRVKDLLYLGTTLGVYVSVDGGASWQSLSNNLPTASVHDLLVHPRDNELVIGTHGRSVYVLDVSTIQSR